MRNIFIGFLLIFLDFNLNLGSSTIGLIPDFVGYIILVKGLDELAAEGPSFTRIRPFAVGMGVYCGILYALDVFGLTASLGWIGVILGIAGLILSLYISHTVIEGVRETETKHDADLGSGRLKSTWTVMAVFQAACYAAMLLPALAIICIIVSLIAGIVFLVAMNDTKKRYEAMPPDAVGVDENPWGTN